MPSRSFAWLAHPNERSATSAAMQANDLAIMLGPPSSMFDAAVLNR